MPRARVVFEMRCDPDQVSRVIEKVQEALAEFEGSSRCDSTSGQSWCQLHRGHSGHHREGIDVWSPPPAPVVGTHWRRKRYPDLRMEVVDVNEWRVLLRHGTFEESPSVEVFHDNYEPL